jgi:hypothetical protein
MSRKFIGPLAALVAGAFILGACHRIPASGPLAAGVRASEDGLWDEAAERWQKALAEDPGSAAAHNNLAVAAERRGRNDEALRDYQAAARLDPDNTWIRENLARFERAGESAPEESPAAGGDLDQAPGVRSVSFTVHTAAAVDLGAYSEIQVTEFRQEQEGPDPELAAWLTEQLTSQIGRTFKGTVIRRAIDWNGAARLDDPGFWRGLGAGLGEGVFLSGKMRFSGTTEKALPVGGLVRDGPFAAKNRGLQERRRFTLSLEPVLLSAATGTPVFRETYSDTQIYDGPGPADEVAFAALLDKVLPRFLAAILGADRSQSRYLLLR